MEIKIIFSGNSGLVLMFLSKKSPDLSEPHAEVFTDEMKCQVSVSKYLG